MTTTTTVEEEAVAEEAVAEEAVAEEVAKPYFSFSSEL